MLNEFLEFESYITAPQSDSPRLQPKYLTNSFGPDYKLNQIDQVLTIIARGVLFSYNDNPEDRIKFTIEILGRWCGLVKKEETESQAVKEWFKGHPEADGWLEEYWKYHFLQEKSNVFKKENDEEKANEEWSACIEKWRTSFTEKDYTSESSTFNNIIANALAQGPLSEKYCLVKKNEKETCTNFKSRTKDMTLKEEMEILDYLFDCSNKTHATNKLKMLRNIVAFLIWQEEHPGKQKEVLLKKGRLLGWYGLDDSSGKAKIWCLDNFSWNGNPIIQRNTYDDFTKFSIASDYLNIFDFKLIDPTQEKVYMEKYSDDYWILKDEGHGMKKMFTILNE